MTRTSCIAHKASQQVVIIREDYLSMCDGNHCAAALLNVFEYWMTYKLDHRDQAQIENKIAAAGGAALIDDDLWVYKTTDNLKDELLGLFADTKITIALTILKNKGFITTRNNPLYGWDRTLQYLFNTEAVQAAVNNSSVYTNLKNKVSKPRKQRIETLKITDETLKNKVAIPETTTESNTNTSAPIGTGMPLPPNVIHDVLEQADKVIAAIVDKPEKKPRKSNPMFDAVCEHVFGIDPKLVDDEGGRIGPIASWLSGKSDGTKRVGGKVGFISRPAEPEHVKRFTAAYKAEHPKLGLPLDFIKFVEAWRKWASTTAKKPVIKPVQTAAQRELTPVEREELAIARQTVRPAWEMVGVK